MSVQAVLNHENAIANIAKALSRIGEALPRIELAARLFPTARMTTTVEGLYSHIIQFLLRAHVWYQEGTLKHILHSVTRPFELRYQDLLHQIDGCSREIEQMAVSGSQFELREVHSSLKIMAARMERTESTMIEMRTLLASKHWADPRIIYLLIQSRLSGYQSAVPCRHQSKGFRFAVLRNGQHRSRAI